MKSILFMLIFVVGGGALAPACSANPLVVGREIDGGVPVACAPVGGACAPDASADRDAGTADTSPGDNDGGSNDAGSAGALPDAGLGREGGAADAAPSHDDGGNTDGGVTACALAGGTCIGPSVGCAIGAPASAQDCTPPSGGIFCCLSTK